MIKWEYKICQANDRPAISPVEWLNSYGVDGWELVSTEGGSLIFKRPIGQPEDEAFINSVRHAMKAEFPKMFE